MLLSLTIEKLIYGGEGLARMPAGPDGRSLTVLAPFVLPGEQVEAEVRQERPGFARATVTQLVKASPERIDPGCRYFQKCGGCHYQHTPYERQLAFKAQIMRETLQRVGKIELKNEIQLHPSPAWNYRNRTRLQVGTDPAFALGYYRFASRDFLPISECPISSPAINAVIGRLSELDGLSCPRSVEELELFADASDEKLLAWAFYRDDAKRREEKGKKDLIKEEPLEKDLCDWAERVRGELPGIAGISFFPARQRTEDEDAAGESARSSKFIAQSGEATIRYRVASDEYQVSAGAFFQTNRHLVDELVSVITKNVAGNIALDLYAGVGLFSVPLARSFHHIFAVESSLISCADLRHNVPTNVKVVCARTEEYLRSGAVRNRPDLIVLDPPRAGAGKAVTRSLIELGAPRICYIACDPATLARDLGPLVAAGYRIEEAHLFDLFPQTFHIESVMMLAR
ncbi:MAG: 23S rRNA (uracil(1939)-C(5))-methyltransferase RlmD [Mycobacterium sp.]